MTRDEAKSKAQEQIEETARAKRFGISASGSSVAAITRSLKTQWGMACFADVLAQEILEQQEESSGGSPIPYKKNRIATILVPNLSSGKMVPDHLKKTKTPKDLLGFLKDQ
jgi:hypothetical protein